MEAPLMSGTELLNLGMVESESIWHQGSAALRVLDSALSLILVQTPPFLMQLVDSWIVVVRVVTSLLVCPSLPVVPQDVHHAVATWSLCREIHQRFWANRTFVYRLWVLRLVLVV